MQIEKTKSLELKKHVGAIHSTNSMTLVQRKIANGLLYNAYDELLDKEEHTINIKDLCDLIGYDSNDHKTIKKALVNLLSTVIEWNLVDKDNIDKQGVWNASSIIADASITGALCTYSYSKRMKELLYRPEIYGRLNMLVQAKFKSSYGLALYENCVRYQNLEFTPWFDFMVFRRLMGVEEGKYVIFRDFKKRVLDKAVSEVNDHAPITITPHLRKNQRKIIAIRFFIKPQQTKQPLLSQPDFDHQLEQYLIDHFGMSSAQAEKLISEYSAEYIIEKIQLIKASRSYSQGKIVNLARYLLEALTKDYKSMRSSQVVLNGDKIEKEARGSVKEEDERDLHKRILTKFANLTAVEKNNINNQFEIYLGKGGYLDTYHEVGLANTIIADKFCFFIRGTFPGFLEC